MPRAAATALGIASADIALEIVLDLLPTAGIGDAVRRWVMAFGVEKQALHAGGEARCEQDLGQVVDVEIAAAGVDARQLFFLCKLEKHLARGDESMLASEV